MAYAAVFGADPIVTSTHDRSGANHWVYGGLAERWLRRAPIPILLIRARRASAAEQQWNNVCVYMTSWVHYTVSY